MKKVLIVAGSPRKNGNGDAMAAAVERGVLAAGGTAETFVIRDKKVNGCVGCGACRKLGRDCVQQDDYAPIPAKIREYDALVILAPVYFSHVNAQTKAFIDRTYCVPWGENGFGEKSADKKIGVVLTFGSAPLDAMGALAAQVAGYYGVRGIKQYKSVLARGCAALDTCANNEEYLAAAEELGRWLAE